VTFDWFLFEASASHLQVSFSGDCDGEGDDGFERHKHGSSIILLEGEDA